jgi:hypothetical protein
MVSAAGELFPISLPEEYFDGVRFLHHYVKDSRGVSGDKGLSSAAASCPTLDPFYHDVLRLSCSDVKGFQRLIRWYTGEESLGLGLARNLANTEVTGASTIVSREPEQESVSSKASSSLGGDFPNGLAVLSSSLVDCVAETPAFGELSGADEVKVMADPERRRVVELHAVAVASKFYRCLGFNVTELGKPYDLLCEPTTGAPAGSPVVHVEVKGSVGEANTVHLTRNEVLHARETTAWRTDLAIVNCIRLEQTTSGWTASAGSLRRFEAWRPTDADLMPLDYEYRVPAIDVS